MHEFKYKKSGEFYCEDVPLEGIVKKYPTPFYLYSYETIMDHFNKIKEAFNEVDPLICFSTKANSNLNILKALVNAGSGLDIVSGGELYKALKAGCPSERIVYASVGKTAEEIEKAAREKILFFNVESVPELIMINTIAGRLKRKANVAIRINPDIKPETHDYITTGAKENKFGVDFKTAEKIFDNRNKYSHVALKGIHVHIGSQITDTAPFVKAVKKILKFLKEKSIDIEWLNLGGGFGIVYGKEKGTTAKEFADALIPLVRNKSFRVILEPGRFVIGNSGILVTKVLYAKIGSGGKRFAIVDAGMNDLVRPSLYDAYHEILPIKKRASKIYKYDVVGPICESGDYLALGRKFPELLAGDYLAVMGAGAYGFTMASNYNSRRRPAELIVINGKVELIRARETYSDLIRGEKIIRELR